VLTPANIVHHIEHLGDNPDKALSLDNLESVCAACHNQLHPEKAGGKATERKVRRRKARVIKMVGNGIEGIG
jgi:5-methylcytosine-specific restriction endonuclease McrA